MSMHGSADCDICGAHTDYCHLTTATGIDIDCRDLKLRNPADLERNIELAASLREAPSATPENVSPSGSGMQFEVARAIELLEQGEVDDAIRVLEQRPERVPVEQTALDVEAES